MDITERDIDEFLEFRSRFTKLQWFEMERAFDYVLESRKNAKLTDSELKLLKQTVKQNKFI